MNCKSLESKKEIMMQSILITGATGAIGSALAQQVLQQATAPIHLHLVARQAEPLAALSVQLAAVQPAAHIATYSADLTQESAVQSLFDTLAASAAPPTALAHCVGSTVIKPLHLTALADFMAQYEQNTVSAFLVLKAFVAQRLKAKQGGSAALVSSVVAHAGFANHEAVAAAKAGVAALVQSAAATYADRGIRVNAVSPALTRSNLTARFIATPEAEARSASMIPLGRIGEPADIAALLAFLLSDHSAFITGQVIPVDGGQAQLKPLPKMTVSK
ncbi:SDR family NAD(P)-dependent oxidoreductase [Parvibium lacunae]|uniref:SDR family NAD(P)-dependent oxidoreductase n=2 Tax=Parvibium lacunae TaxID=1888893 RepID=A0A368L7D7_9BURK|nr:SDR family NAD(P)-dependent oxidoreductase [Parvibium lacunae]